MNPHTFTAGDEAYLEDGQVVEFCAKIGDGYIVRPCYGGDDDEPWHGEPITVRLVFAEPPVARYSERIAEARTELAEAEAKLSAARAALYGFEAEERSRRDRIAAHGFLEDLDNFLAGKVTHVVYLNEYGGPEIRPVGEATEERSEWFRLVALTAPRQWPEPPKPAPCWQFNREGKSGRPFTSIEEARAFAEADLSRRLERMKADPRGLRALRYSYKACGVAFPAWADDIVNAVEREEAEKTVAVQEAQLTAARAKLAALPKVGAVA